LSILSTIEIRSGDPSRPYDEKLPQGYRRAWKAFETWKMSAWNIAQLSLQPSRLRRRKNEFNPGWLRVGKSWPSTDTSERSSS